MTEKFSKYDSYKETNIFWAASIPVNWKEIKIKHLFSERSEKGFPNEPLLSATQRRGVIPTALYETRTVVATKGFETLKRVDVGDFVISLRSFQGGIEYAYYHGIISPAYTVMTPKSLIYKGFFKYLAKSYLFIDLLKTCVTGIREGQNINYTLLKKSYLPVPTWDEQIQIERFLDFKVAKISIFIKDKKREIELLKEQKQAEINRAVTKGLNPDVPMKDSGIDWIGKLPKHWEVRRLRTFCDFVNRGSTPAYTEEKLTKVVNQATFSKGYWDLKNVRYSTANAENNRGLLFPDDILLASTGGGVLGKSYLFKENDSYIADSHVTIIRDSKRRFIPEYLYYFLSVSYDLINGILAQGSTNQTELQRNWLRSMFFPYPDINEQRDIAVFLTNFENTINTIIKSIEIEIVKIQEYKISLISEVVTGKVDVRDVKIDEFFELETLDETEAEVEAEELTLE